MPAAVATPGDLASHFTVFALFFDSTASHSDYAEVVGNKNFRCWGYEGRCLKCYTGLIIIPAVEETSLPPSSLV